MIRWGSATNGAGTAGTVQMPQDDTERVPVQPPTFPSRSIHEQQPSVTGFEHNWATPVNPPQQPQLSQLQVPPPHPQSGTAEPPTRRQQNRKRKSNQVQQQHRQQPPPSQQQQVSSVPLPADRLGLYPPALPSPTPSSIPTPPSAANQHSLVQATPVAATSTPAPQQTPPTWNVAGTATPARNSAMPQSPAPTLAPPPEGIYRSFEDLLTAVQRVAKDQGYGVVKLRSSNYREGKPTRFDLVCDRGGVKYASTAKKRNPSTRKVDCPWRGKAVCEVQLGNQWRFVVQESRHNHEPRLPAAPPGQENTPVAQSLRTLINKIDRMQHDMSQSFEKLEKRIEAIEQLTANQANRVSLMGGPGPLVDSRLNNMEARINAMESRQNGMDLPMDEVDSRLLAGTVM